MDQERRVDVDGEFHVSQLTVGSRATQEGTGTVYDGHRSKLHSCLPSIKTYLCLLGTCHLLFFFFFFFLKINFFKKILSGMH